MQNINDDTKAISFFQFLSQTQSLTTSQLNQLDTNAENEDSLIETLTANQILKPQQIKALQKFYMSTRLAQYGVYEFDSSIGGILSKETARSTQSAVLSSKNGILQVGITNPLNTARINLINKEVGKACEYLLISEDDLAQFHSKIYNYDTKIKQLLLSVQEEYKGRTIIEEKETADGNESIIKQLIKTLILNTAQKNASDIHIEYIYDRKLEIKTRVDGTLTDAITANHEMGHFLFRSIKILADLDITKEKSPLDGRITLNDQGSIINIRVSIMPLVNGISGVMRILGQSKNYRNMNKLLVDRSIIKTINTYIKQQSGMMLLVGPTGSGKTTTLYTTLANINEQEKKIITIEDPVEVIMPGTNQIQVQPEFNLDFPQALRATLRQDPDVILVGEIRDSITASIATRAAITGHMVLATVHADDVATAIPRLLDLKVDPYFLTSALRLIISQRLIRKLCPFCATEGKLDEESLSTISLTMTKEARKELPENFKDAHGCHTCNFTGYTGRVPVFEKFFLSDEALNLLPHQKHGDLIKIIHRAMQGNHLIDNAFKLACIGITSIDEVARLNDTRQQQ